MVVGASADATHHSLSRRTTDAATWRNRRRPQSLPGSNGAGKDVTIPAGAADGAATRARGGMRDGDERWHGCIRVVVLAGGF